MALGILMILNMALVTIGIIIQVVLYKNKKDSKNSIFIINMLFGVFVSYLAYTSFASNFTLQRLLAIGLGALSVLAVVVKLNTEKFILPSKVMLSISILGSLLQLFL